MIVTRGKQGVTLKLKSGAVTATGIVFKGLTDEQEAEVVEMMKKFPVMRREFMQIKDNGANLPVTSAVTGQDKFTASMNAASAAAVELTALINAPAAGGQEVGAINNTRGLTPTKVTTDKVTSK